MPQAGHQAGRQTVVSFLCRWFYDPGCKAFSIDKTTVTRGSWKLQDGLPLPPEVFSFALKVRSPAGERVGTMGASLFCESRLNLALPWASSPKESIVVGRRERRVRSRAAPALANFHAKSRRARAHCCLSLMSRVRMQHPAPCREASTCAKSAIFLL